MPGRSKTITLLLMSAFMLCSCNAADNTQESVIGSEESGFLPGITFSDSRIKGTYDGVVINAALSESKEKYVDIYTARRLSGFKYDRCSFNSNILTYKAPSDKENAASYEADDYYTDQKGDEYEVFVEKNNEGDDGYYCAHHVGEDSIASKFYEMDLPEGYDFTEALSTISHTRPDGTSVEENLPTDFNHWDVIRFSDNSRYACQYQTINGIPILNGYCPDVVKWSDEYYGMGMDAGTILHTNDTGIWYIQDARLFVDVDDSPVGRCEIKGIKDCFEEGIKEIKSQKYLYGNDPVVYDISIGYIMIAEFDPDNQPSIFSNEPLNIGDVYTLVPVWTFKAYYRSKNIIYSAFVNASTGELL